jgi:hypothetical protein
LQENHHAGRNRHTIAVRIITPKKPGTLASRPKSPPVKLRIPGNVPVNGFWSLTLYESDGGGRWFLYDNVLDRYAISSKTRGLTKEEDGAIVLEISHQEPSDRANWMPAPKGDFRHVFRAYKPQRSLTDGTFLLPPVQKVADPASL